ncbi:XRE family transcriptional regulator [Paraburkholderia sp.]|uniref:helix-turn-helix domain-containing protein n=1 Tax=Paraburkholderia sp. TaxID=1926495 RepID=UPI00286F4F55|nr:XRE family transcriptional regulator [Paraburkholderia sp.]
MPEGGTADPSRVRGSSLPDGKKPRNHTDVYVGFAAMSRYYSTQVKSPRIRQGIKLAAHANFAGSASPGEACLPLIHYKINSNLFHRHFSVPCRVAACRAARGIAVEWNMVQIDSERDERGLATASGATAHARDIGASASASMPASAPASDDAIAQEEAKICARLKALRLARRIDLKTLAALSGFTEDQLRSMESGVRAPPFASLARLGRCLGEDLSYFFVDRSPAQTQQADRRMSIVRNDERKPVARDDAALGFEYATLAHHMARKRMEPLYFSFSAHAQHDYFFEHPGEEFVFVLEGQLDFEIVIDKDVKTIRLEQGDSFYFDSALPHRCFAAGADAKALMVVVNQEDKR